MKNDGKKASAWGAMLLFVLLIGAAGFALWLLSLSLHESASDDARRVRTLAIAADNLEKWPETAQQIGRANVFQALRHSRSANVRLWLNHPDFGDFPIDYWAARGGCRAETIIANDTMTVRGQALISPAGAAGTSAEDRSYLARAWDAIPDVRRGRSICFQIANLDLRSIGLVREFRYLLLASAPRNGREPSDIRAQIGVRRLPIRAMDDLPRIGGELRAADLARDALSASGVKSEALKPTANRDALQPVESRVAGERLRFYFHPVTLAAQGAERTGYMLVGAVGASGTPGLGDPGAKLFAFGLAFALFLALVPVIKLGLLGPVDTLRPVEVAATGGGLLVAVALMTTALLDARDTVDARHAAERQVRAGAAALARAARIDIEQLVTSCMLPDLSKDFVARSGEMVRYVKHVDCSDAGAWSGKAGWRNPMPPRISATLLIDRNGRQPRGAVMLSPNDQQGSDYRVADRSYFRRVMAGDYAPGADAWRVELARHAGGVWAHTSGGVVVDQIRSRPDGVAKLVAAVRLDGVAGLKGLPPNLSGRDAPAVVLISGVLPRLLQRPLPAGVGYAIVDTAEEQWPALFHADRGRAGTERFLDGLDPATQQRMRAAVRYPTGDCASAARAVVLAGRYDGDMMRFGVTAIPCTTWAAVTFVKRDGVDRAAAYAAEHGLLFWAVPTAGVLLLWFMIALVLRDQTWCWLWPDPRKQERGAYMRTCLALAATIVVTLLAWLGGVRPAGAALIAVAGTAVALALLYREHVLIRRECFHVSPTDTRSREMARLNTGTEHWYLGAITLLIVCVAVLPVAALNDDARSYFAQRRAGADLVARADALRERSAMLARIDRTFRPQTAASPPVMSETPPGAQCPASGTGSATAALRRFAGLDAGARCGEPQPVTGGDWSNNESIGLWAMLFGFVALAMLALRTIGRGLFGFGVPLEAIEYPILPRGWIADRRLDALPERFMVIGAPGEVQDGLRAAAGSAGLVDLMRPGSIDTAAVARAPLIVFDNLELLLRDEEKRRLALARIEQVIGALAPGQRVGLIASLSPLDRLLQTFEREAEELDAMAPEARVEQGRLNAKFREDVRWSRLFERFHAYVYARRPRAGSPGAWLQEAGVEKPVDPVLVRRLRAVWREAEYVSNGALEPLVAQDDAAQGSRARWAVNLAAAGPSRDAIVDYLSSMLIEHYQFQWAISSRAERLLLYRFAFHQIPNIAAAYALRSLVRRGLVVLDPYPRIMNRSFAQFVRHVEKPETLRRWRLSAEGGLWRTLRTPLIFVIPFALGVLILVGMQNGDSLTSLLPLFVAAGPALLNAVSSGRRTGAA